MRAAAQLPLPGRLAALLVVSLLSACATDPEPVATPAPAIVEPVVVAPPAVESASVAPPPAPAPVPRFAGHVASYKTLTEAEAAWPRLAERFPVLKDAPRRYVEVDLGGQRGKVVRLLLGGFVDQPGAMAYCRGLRGVGLYCAPHDLPA